MEPYFTAHSDKFDHGVMDRFLNLSELPVIGSSALEQILHQASLDFPTSASGASASVTSAPEVRNRFSSSPSSQSSMSPDSSQWTASTSGVESGSESSDTDCLPDSTVKDKEDDRLSTNSDPLNSSSSEYSYTASPAVYEPVLHDDSLLGSSLASSTDTSVTSNTASLKRKGEAEDSSVAPSKKRTRKSKAGPNELCCPLCEYSTRVKEHLASHMNSHTSDRKYMCGQCGQTFKWSHSLRRHQRTHQKDYKFTCAHCPKTFSRKDHLAVHEKLHDSDNTESYPCPECGVKFKNKKTLTGHVKTHSTDKPHKCDSCDSAFTRKASLTRHVLAAHAGHVFHCDICSAPFSYKSTLEDHRRAVHNEGKRDFHCLGCGLSFACKSYLQKHMAVCKNRADKEEVPCTECGKLFPSRKQMSEHRRTRHRHCHQSQAQLALPPPALMAPTQNMGHNLGQYFSSKPQYRPAPSNTLPPFSHPAPLYHAPMAMANEKPVFSQTADQSEARKQPQAVCRCDVCHACFPSEQALEKHLASHWAGLDTDLGGQVKPLTGSDLSLAAHAQSGPMRGQEEPSGPMGVEQENVGSLLRQVYNTEHISEQYHQQKMTHPHHQMQDLSSFCDYPPPAFDSFLYYNA